MYSADGSGDIQRSLVRIVFVFAHRLGRMMEVSTVNNGTLECTTMWAVRLDYVTAEAGGKRTTDRTTQLTVIPLRKTRFVFPVDHHEHAVHMFHAYPSVER